MSIKQIETLVFDYGGVIVNIDDASVVKAMESLGVTAFKRLIHVRKIKRLMHQYINGLVAESETLKEMLSLCRKGTTTEDIEKVLEELCGNLPVERLEALVKLRKQYKVYLLSNINDTLWQKSVCLTKQLGYSTDELFDEVFLSYAMRKEKPSVEIYEEMTKQFFALTFHLPDGSLVISYRGTDMSLTGWKEDFNMSFEDTVPSQKDALSYLNRIAAKYKGKIFLTGHSKGGNLAVYATANASKRIQQRIVRVFNNDGPGFNEESRTYSILPSIADKVVTIVPSSSIVGMLLEHLPSYRVIESTSVSIFQHDPYTWCFDGPHFAYKENLSDDSLMMNRILSTWIKSLSREKRETFVDSLFSIFGNAGIKTFRLNSTDVIMRGPDFIRAYFSLAREERKMLKDVTMSLARIAGEMFFDHDEEKGKEKGLLDEKGKKGELQ